jgi:ParB family transcriptional regulator, chromosome partitioning protein
MVVQSNADLIEKVPFHQLFLSPDNVRKDESELGIEELADLIAAEGVLQNIAGYKEMQGRGKHKTTAIGVVAGGRRFRALTLLVAQKRIEPDYGVPCLIVSRERALAISLSENSGHKDLHPADQFVAFRDLVKQGKSIEEVAVAFSVSPLVVQRRLRLANVHADFLEMFRKRTIKIDHMMALAVTDDTERQQAAWLALPESRRTPEALREVLTETEVAASRPLAKFVGLEAYRAAGGPVRTDLFSEDDEDSVYLLDAALLQGLAQKKLTAAAEALKSEAGAWIEISPRLDFVDLATYSRVKTISREPTPEESEKLVQVTTEVEELETQLYDLDLDDDFDDDDSDEDEVSEENDTNEHENSYAVGEGRVPEEGPEDVDVEAARRLQERLDVLRHEEQELREALRVPDPAQETVAGTLLAVDRDGQLKVYRGLLKSEDAKRFADEEKRAAKALRPKVAGGMATSLVLRLSAHRTQALQAMLTDNTKVALTALCHRMVMAAFFDSRNDYATSLRVEILEPDLRTHADDLEGSKAYAIVQARREAWRNRLPENPAEVFSWILQQSDATVAELLAFCTSLSLDDIQAQIGGTRTEELAEAVRLDMSDWWAPTASGYLGKIKKDQILAIVKGVVSPEKAARLEKMKKSEMAKAAEEALIGSRWVPPYYKQAGAV